MGLLTVFCMMFTILFNYVLDALMALNTRGK